MKLDLVALTNRNALTRFLVPKADRVVQMATKVAPEAALVGGIVTGGVAAYKFAQAYSEHTEVFEELDDYVQVARDALDQAKEQEFNGEDAPISVKDATYGLGRVYGAYAAQLVKHYGPSLAWGGVSLYLLLTSHGIMRGRNKALLASAKAIEVAFSEYRKRVVENEGEAADQRYFHGTREEVIVEKIVDENGKSKKNKTTQPRIGEDPGLLYSRVYDASNIDHEADRSLNLFKLKSIQSWMNDMLRIRKVIMLNDVYDELSLARSPEGAVVGWALNGPGDDFIDFGLDDPVNHGPENRFLLNFNVNGVVYDLIGT
jgi:hypothetical protein